MRYRKLIFNCLLSASVCDSTLAPFGPLAYIRITLWFRLMFASEERVETELGVSTSSRALVCSFPSVSRRITCRSFCFLDFQLWQKTPRKTLIACFCLRCCPLFALLFTRAFVDNEYLRYRAPAILETRMLSDFWKEDSGKATVSRRKWQRRDNCNSFVKYKRGDRMNVGLWSPMSGDQSDHFISIYTSTYVGW